MNYYDTYNNAYGARTATSTASSRSMARTTFYGVNDAMWSKYRIGEFLETQRPEDEQAGDVESLARRTGRTRHDAPAGEHRVAAEARRTFIICNNALTIFSGMLAQARGSHADSVYADLKANILPGVTLVPGMVVAIEKAQGRGIAYHRQ